MRHLVIILFYLYPFISVSQISYYSKPVKIPLLLSANFGELRSNHFHSGIDIKIQGKTGLPIYASAGGFISRIVVSPFGLGKAIYIDHPNNTTTVYGHLDSFRDDLTEFIKNKQYENESFEIDIKPGSGEFIVKKGELIGKGGNSGSSAGPHLHFEIRETDTENPVNPLTYLLKVPDKTPPVIYSLMVVPLDENSLVNHKNTPLILPCKIINGKYLVNSGKAIQVQGKIGFAIEANDFINGSTNKCGIYKLQLKIDKEELFSYRLDKFSFRDTRYINSHIVYSELTKSGRWFQKTWIEPGNKLRIYNFSWDKGILDVADGEKRNVEIVASDANGNKSAISFNLSGKFNGILSKRASFSEFFEFNKNNSFTHESFEIDIPKGSLYEDLKFNYKIASGFKGFYSDLIIIQNSQVPLHKNVTLEIKTTDLPRSLEDKALIVKVNETTGKESSIGGKYNNGWTSVETREFGAFAVTIDTIKPVIIPLNIKANKLTEPANLKFKITDNLSGIKKIEGRLNENWVLFDYDPKNQLIVHYFDKSRFEFGKRQIFILKVTDSKNNIAIYESDFWK